MRKAASYLSDEELGVNDVLGENFIENVTKSFLINGKARAECLVLVFGLSPSITTQGRGLLQCNAGKSFANGEMCFDIGSLRNLPDSLLIEEIFGVECFYCGKPAFLKVNLCVASNDVTILLMTEFMLHGSLQGMPKVPSKHRWL